MNEPGPNKEQDFELIGRFHDFALSEAELSAFEERLGQDPVFQERFRLYDEMEQTIEQTFPLEEKDQAKHNFHTAAIKGEQQATRDRSRPSWRSLRVVTAVAVVRIAAAIALVVAVGMWWLFQGPSLESPETLAAYYWDKTEKSHLLDAVQRSSGEPDRNEPARNFFRSLEVLQENGQYNSMIDQLEIYKQTTTEPVPFEDDADWLLAIALLGNGNLDRARTQLELVLERYPARSESAQELLEYMDQLK